MLQWSLSTKRSWVSHYIYVGLFTFHYSYTVFGNCNKLHVRCWKGCVVCAAWSLCLAVCCMHSFFEPPAALSRRIGYVYFCPVSLLVGWLVGWFRLWPLRYRISAVTKFAHEIDVGSRLKTYFRQVFSPTPKKFGGENLKFSTTAVNRQRVTSKRLDISKNEFQMFQ